MWNLLHRKRVALLCASIVFAAAAHSQQANSAAIIRGIDASVGTRNDSILEYTVTEHYAVFRNQDRERPAAEMTVKTTYKKDGGKSYAILNETGSSLLRKEVLERVLDNERLMSQPANRAMAIVTSANYIIAVKGSETLNGRNCIAVSLEPRRSSPYLFKGTAWVDAKNYAIVQLQGVAARSHSMLTGPAQVFRQYAQISGLPMATHAKAVSSSWLVGQTTVTIDYTGYEIKQRSNQ